LKDGQHGYIYANISGEHLTETKNRLQLIGLGLDQNPQGPFKHCRLCIWQLRTIVLVVFLTYFQ